MTRVEGKDVVIDRPVEDVWSFMIDISNMPRWEDSRAEWTQTSEGPIDSGSTFQSSIRLFGREVMNADLRIAEFEPNRKFAAEAMNGIAKGTKFTYLMEPVEAGKTRLSRVTDVQLHGLGTLLRPFLAPLARKAGGIEANNVKRIVESQH